MAPRSLLGELTGVETGNLHNHPAVLTGSRFDHTAVVVVRHCSWLLGTFALCPHRGAVNAKRDKTLQYGVGAEL